MSMSGVNFNKPRKGQLIGINAQSHHATLFLVF
jgi:hypothetical protein